MFVPPISNVVACTSPATVNIPEPSVNKSVSPAPPIVPPALITKSSDTVNRPAELNDIFSAAASDAPVLNDNLVALLSAAKSPSDTASIPAATKIASVPVPSSGAWKSILPITSFAAISVSPVCNVNVIGVSSPVAVFFIVTLPTEEILIFSAAASLAPVLKLNFVALLSAANVSSATASMAADIRIASVPPDSSGAWKLIVPKGSPTVKASSPVCRVNDTGVPSPVAVCFKRSPALWLCISLTSPSSPNNNSAASESN